MLNQERSPATPVEAGPPPLAAPVREAVQQALAFHAWFRERVDVLDTSLAEASPALRAPWETFHRAIMHHIKEEEEGLLPSLLGLTASGTLTGESFAEQIAHLQCEIDQIGTMTAALRATAVCAGEHETALLDLLDALDAHARQEEETLLPAVLDMLEEMSDTQPPREQAIRQTQGVCPTCLALVPAVVINRDGSAYLEKTCDDCGLESQLLSRNAAHWGELDRFYFEVNGEQYPQRDYIVRMTERCNLDCPICLARANEADTPDLDLTGLERLLRERSGLKIDLMAAEPTLRADLPDWIRRVKAEGHIAALHTNGLKLANPKYARTLAEAGVDEVFLQFDGFDPEADRALRGRPLLERRLATLNNLRELGIGTSLITVIAHGLNEKEVGRVYRFALRPENAHIREVFFMGLRSLGRARDRTLEGTMMPDELIDMLCEQEPEITRRDILRFNKIYFALLSAFKVKKCLYIQHYLVVRDGKGGATPVADVLDLAALEKAAERYSRELGNRPRLARARLVGALARDGVQRKSARMLLDLIRLQNLFRSGMNLGLVPRRFLLLGFITACDPKNFDAQVAMNCGKGELSVDGGFTDSGAWANVWRETRQARGDS